MVAPKVAELVYKASLKVSPELLVKLWVPVNNSFLKLVVKVEVIAMFIPHKIAKVLKQF